jgi:hypothetical protein
MTHHNCITLSPKLQPFMPHFDFTATFPLAQNFRIPCYQHHTSQLPVTPPSYISLSRHFNPTPLTRNAPCNASPNPNSHITNHHGQICESSVTPPQSISLSSHLNPTPLTRNAPRNTSSYARNNTTFHNNKIRESSVTLTSSTSLPGYFNSFSAMVTPPGMPLKDTASNATPCAHISHTKWLSYLRPGANACVRVRP